jgi:hypothetical protein
MNPISCISSERSNLVTSEKAHIHRYDTPYMTAMSTYLNQSKQSCRVDISSQSVMEVPLVSRTWMDNCWEIPYAIGTTRLVIHCRFLSTLGLSFSNQVILRMLIQKGLHTRSHARDCNARPVLNILTYLNQ